MRAPLILNASYLAATSFSLTTKRAAPTCTDITLPVSIKAQNLNLPSTLNASNFADFIKSLGGSAFDLLTNTIDIEGTYNIAGTYCEPAVSIPSRASTLQFLVHGITQTRTYWSALGPAATESEYSWLDYASSQGYPTFSIDRLGAGASDHPDGLLTVQIFSQVQVIKSIVDTIKNSTSVGGKSWEKVIYVGHSFGSELANAYQHSYPTGGVDAYIMTGYTPYINNGLPALAALGQAAPADLVLPERFGSLDPSYLTATNQNGTDHLFFYVPDIDPSLLETSWTTRGTVTLGEIISTLLTPYNVPAYTGDLFVVTGQQDAIFCAEGIGGIETIVTMVGDCGSGATSKAAAVKGQYPNVRNFGTFEPEDTGHGTVLQYSAQSQFKEAHDWLASVGY
jgi:pimeloyl-ACP methyl ester carboxylesterase